MRSLNPSSSTKPASFEVPVSKTRCRYRFALCCFHVRGCTAAGRSGCRAGTAKKSSHPWHFRCWSLRRNELECTNLVYWREALHSFSSRDAIIVVSFLLEKHFDGDFTQHQEKEITLKRWPSVYQSWKLSLALNGLKNSGWNIEKANPAHAHAVKRRQTGKKRNEVWVVYVIKLAWLFGELANSAQSGACVLTWECRVEDSSINSEEGRVVWRWPIVCLTHPNIEMLVSWENVPFTRQGTTAQTTKIQLAHRHGELDRAEHFKLELGRHRKITRFAFAFYKLKKNNEC